MAWLATARQAESPSEARDRRDIAANAALSYRPIRYPAEAETYPPDA